MVYGDLVKIFIFGNISNQEIWKYSLLFAFLPVPCAVHMHIVLTYMEILKWLELWMIPIFMFVLGWESDKNIISMIWDQGYTQGYPNLGNF